MLNAEKENDKRFVPQLDGAIVIKLNYGREITAYPDTFLHQLAAHIFGKTEKEVKDGNNGRQRKKTN